jgi:hypothetical protein
MKNKDSSFHSEFRNPHSEFKLPDRPASVCGRTIGPPAGILFPPMLFAHNPAKGGTPGPQARFSVEEKGIKVKVSKGIFPP